MMKNTEKFTIAMKSDEMEKHCNLLLTRVLSEFNIQVRNAKDKEILVVEEGEYRVIGLRYTKQSSIGSNDNLYTVNIVLIDRGNSNLLELYYDEDSMSIVHDVEVYGFTVMSHGEVICDDYNKLKAINNKLLMDLRKPLNVSVAKTYSNEEYNLKVPLVAIEHEKIEKQLKPVIKTFLKDYKNCFPEEFNKKINMVKNESRHGFELGNKVNVWIESRNFADCSYDNWECEVAQEYMISIVAPNESEISIRLRNIDTPDSKVSIYQVKSICVAVACENGDFIDYKYPNEIEEALLYTFSRISYMSLPKGSA